MNIYNKREYTKSEAEAKGFTIDTTIYPWFAYKGPRFRPTESAEVYTDLEAELLSLIEDYRRNTHG